MTTAISIAQGWQLARAVRLKGLNSVECLAAQAQAAGIFGRINILIDAQRDEYYRAVYEIDAGLCRVVEPLHLAGLDHIAGHEAHFVVPPELLARFPRARVLLPDAAVLGQLAAIGGEFISGDRLEPVYLRETIFVKAPPPRTLPTL